MEDIRIKDVMTRRVVSVDENDSVTVVAEAMARNRVGSLIVRSEFGPIGIITESDIVKKMASHKMDAEKTKAGEIMNTPMIFVTPEQDVEYAANIMVANKIRRLPVLQNNKIVGIVTHTDIVRAAPSMLSLLDARLRMRVIEAEIPTRESRVRVGGVVGLCESCGMYSTDLGTLDEDLVCEKCATEKHGDASARKKSGFRDWSRMS